MLPHVQAVAAANWDVESMALAFWATRLLSEMCCKAHLRFFERLSSDKHGQCRALDNAGALGGAGASVFRSCLCRRETGGGKSRILK